jgi:redox-sensitive bicupin YhaK (pirin superfamily)
MLTIRKSEEGHADHGWLNSFHISRSPTTDPAHVSLRPARINEDRVAPAAALCPPAPRHGDLTTCSASRPQGQHAASSCSTNEIQRMSAGSGVVHSEFNGSETEPVHFMQIWIEPKSRGTTPSYEQLKFDAAEKLDRFKLLASATPVEGAATINQDATVSVAELTPGKQLTYPLGGKRHAWLHVIDGNVTVNGKPLQTGDAVAVDKEEKLDVVAQGSSNSEILLFDLA